MKVEILVTPATAAAIIGVIEAMNFESHYGEHAVMRLDGCAYVTSGKARYDVYRDGRVVFHGARRSFRGGCRPVWFRADGYITIGERAEINRPYKIKSWESTTITNPHPHTGEWELYEIEMLESPLSQGELIELAYRCEKMNGHHGAVYAAFGRG